MTRQVLERCEDAVERVARAECGAGFYRVRKEVAADIGGVPLDGDKLVDDGFLVGAKLFGDVFEDGLELGIAGLGGECFRPVEG